MKKLLIANRGEIAIRIARAAADLGIPAVAVYSRDDEQSLHVRRADDAFALGGSGPAAYLDIDALLAAAQASGCDAIHPGYGFLSESPGFARRCADSGVTFVGPTPELLELFGDKVRARALAARTRIPLLEATCEPTSLEQAQAFFASLGDNAAVMIKSISGGGGRGIRAVYRAEDLEQAFARCRSEAKAAFGKDELYVERLIRRARHIEVQIVGDRTGAITHLWERDCTLQRRNQKLVELAPAPELAPSLQRQLLAAARALAVAARYQSLGTFEFLIDMDVTDGTQAFVFLEANPRIQVEHTVTEEITGIDLVGLQLRLARGETLKDLHLLDADRAAPRGCAMQMRVNMESMAADGNVVPAGGVISVFEPCSGPGVRVDTFGYSGYHVNPSFDSLLAKVIVHSPSGHWPQLVVRARRALAEFHIEGVRTNIDLLERVLQRVEADRDEVDTRFIETHAADLGSSNGTEQGFPGWPVRFGSAVQPPNTVAVCSRIPGTLIALEVAAGDHVHAGQHVAVVEAMKMEHLIAASSSGVVCALAAAVGSVVSAGDPILYVEPGEVAGATVVNSVDDDLDACRPDLAEVLQRRASIRDEARPEAVAKRRKTGQRTARENLHTLFDRGEFIEYGAFTVAAQRSRRPIDELQRISPADGLITGMGLVNSDVFGEERARCLAMAYDYAVFAGTQGHFSHTKKDRMLDLAGQWRLPIVLFAEGGGGRPGDTDWVGVSGLSVTTFSHYAALSGLVPLVGIVSGRCFAGNAALLGCSDVIIAAKNSSIGMGGPAMIEGAGLGTFKPEEVGPVRVQAPNGVIDVVVADELEAVHTARRYLSYFQGPIDSKHCTDQRLLRRLVPENRLRAYDVRAVITTLADTDSVLELRRDFGVGIITAFVRIDGRPFGLIANNPVHLGGAIDAEAADKTARFMQLCDAFDLPIVSLCDTPGFMVGPEAEKTAQVRRFCRMFVVGASVTVPIFAVVLRKAYGLGAQAMTGGNSHRAFFTVAWPSGEFGAMGLEGGVRLGFRKEFEAIADPAARQALLNEKVASAYAQGKAINVASFFEIDCVIDPRDTRAWIMRGLRSTSSPATRHGKKRLHIDTW